MQLDSLLRSWRRILPVPRSSPGLQQSTEGEEGPPGPRESRDPERDRNPKPSLSPIPVSKEPHHLGVSNPGSPAAPPPRSPLRAQLPCPTWPGPRGPQASVNPPNHHPPSAWGPAPPILRRPPASGPAGLEAPADTGSLTQQGLPRLSSLTSRGRAQVWEQVMAPRALPCPLSTTSGSAHLLIYTRSGPPGSSNFEGVCHL